MLQLRCRKNHPTTPHHPDKRIETITRKQTPHNPANMILFQSELHGAQQIWLATTVGRKQGRIYNASTHFERVLPRKRVGSGSRTNGKQNAATMTKVAAKACIAACRHEIPAPQRTTAHAGESTADYLRVFVVDVPICCRRKSASSTRPRRLGPGESAEAGDPLPGWEEDAAARAFLRCGKLKAAATLSSYESPKHSTSS